MDLLESLWAAIIRPPRDYYNWIDLGPPLFRLKSQSYFRDDFNIVNNRGLTLECSHFTLENYKDKRPCIIYLHCNSGSRLECLSILDVFLTKGFDVLCFDFAGSGLSEGEYVSLGWFEQDDARDVIDYLDEKGKTTSFVLWGRSMGAATALMHASRDPRVSAIVVDSTFSTLEGMISHVANRYPVPSFIVNMVMSSVKDTIQEKADFDYTMISPIFNARYCKMPAVFSSALEDEIVPCTHSIEVFNAYAGEKLYIPLTGDHNAERPDRYYNEVFKFLNRFITSHPTTDPGIAVQQQL